MGQPSLSRVLTIVGYCNRQRCGTHREQPLTTRSRRVEQQLARGAVRPFAGGLERGTLAVGLVPIREACQQHDGTVTLRGPDLAFTRGRRFGADLVGFRAQRGVRRGSFDRSSRTRVDRLLFISRRKAAKINRRRWVMVDERISPTEQRIANAPVFIANQGGNPVGGYLFLTDRSRCRRRPPCK
jgi:hypothetical protein